MLLQALVQLPKRHQEAVCLRYMEQLDHRSIEERMGISNGTLRGLLNRGLAGLRRRLGNRNTWQAAERDRTRPADD